MSKYRPFQRASHLASTRPRSTSRSEANSWLRLQSLSVCVEESWQYSTSLQRESRDSTTQAWWPTRDSKKNLRDFTAHPDNELFDNIPIDLHSPMSEPINNEKLIEKTFMALSQDRFTRRVKPATYVPTECGNMYCGSLYSGLCGLLSLMDSDQLQGKRVGMFSYGSGLASTMFSLRVVGDTETINTKLDLVK
jgi:hypothetical protein